MNAMKSVTRNSMWTRWGRFSSWLTMALLTLAGTAGAIAGEADIKIPDLSSVKFDGLGGISGSMLMYLGIVMCAIGSAFGLLQYVQT